MPLRKDVPQLCPPLGRLLDFLMYLSHGHVSKNVIGANLIPGARERKKRGRGLPPRRPRSRPHSAPSSRVAQLVEPVLVDPEVVGELVEDGDPDLVLQLPWVVPELLFEWPPVNRDLCRQVGRLLEEPEEIRLSGVLVFHDHRHVLQALRQVRRKLVEGAPDVLLEVEHGTSTSGSAGGGPPRDA